jgi:hypothetical protein
MKQAACVAALMLLFGAARAAEPTPQAAAEVNAYYATWLREHKFSDFDLKQDGIHFRKNGARLDGDIYEIKRDADGKSFTVESRISLRLANGKRFDDFVAGIGKTPDVAFADSMLNLCTTTLHPIYAELFDHKDPHAVRKSWMIDGHKRRIFLTGWAQRGDAMALAETLKVQNAIAGALKEQRLSDELHWAKLVIFKAPGKDMTINFTIDGIENGAVGSALAAHKWPVPKKFYLSKLFFVIGSK